MRGPPLPPRASWQPLVERALAEDIGPGDATSEALLPSDADGTGIIEARTALVACGLPIAEAVFTTVDPTLAVERLGSEGEARERDLPLLRIRGRLRSILAAERTALNFLQRMSGVATWTRRFVRAIDGTGCGLLDTRKTLPGWRVLDKYAAATGGAANHRLGLYDAILIKDNHVSAAGGVGAAVRAARTAARPALRIQVEVESAEQAEEALAAGAEWLLLDNRGPDELRALAGRFRTRAVLEASGGVTLENVRSIAETGVHFVSVGALTHSAPAVDIALELIPEEA
ncbi:carboxylating nicotinate-nucleotide diphosphorylase [Myxococcota bacterium]|nr:carboxylating nicotinate-nucleotide diphosphorylase [Myxococcota bacterium]MCZ7618831.1 carboxylating nicotinate-nucleotide diphosphorylase [Myxococcota bacterium]